MGHRRQLLRAITELASREKKSSEHRRCGCTVRRATRQCRATPSNGHVLRTTRASIPNGNSYLPAATNARRMIQLFSFLASLAISRHVARSV